MVEENQVEIVEETENVESVNELENISQMQDTINQLLEQSNELTAVDLFFTENSDLIITVLKLICFYGFVGVPLFVIVSLFWTVYKQFLYTNI